MKRLMFAACAAMAMGTASAACINWRMTSWDGKSIMGQGSSTDLTRWSFKGRDIQLVFEIAGEVATLESCKSRTQQYRAGEKWFTVVDGVDGLGVQIVGGVYGTAASPLVVSDAKHCVKIQLWANDGYTPDLPLCGKCEPIPEPTAAWLALVAAAVLAVRRGAMK